MPTPSALLNIRRLFLAVLAVGLSGLAAPAQAAAPAPADTTFEADALTWAGRVVAVRRLIAEAEVASPEEAPALAAEAFAGARLLAASSRHDDALRALLLNAQALYERHHGSVVPGALTARELGALRGATLAELTSDDPLALLSLEAVAPVAMVPVLPSALQAPETAEAAIAREEQRMLRMYGGVSGIARRTRRYFPMIERALAQRGLPEELKYVAFIESGLNPGAVSPAGALGMWQMLPSTGAMYGLSEGALSHPARSTAAATRFLAYLGEMFDGDWQLALAAYNCGPGRVQGLVARMERRLGRTPTFWDLYPHLPAETRTYVPRFIAVARAMDEAA